MGAQFDRRQVPNQGRQSLSHDVGRAVFHGRVSCPADRRTQHLERVAPFSNMHSKEGIASDLRTTGARMFVRIKAQSIHDDAGRQAVGNISS